MNRLLLIGLNHQTAPLAVRERLAFTADAAAAARAEFARRFPQAEIVLLSTCNRTELYAARALHGHPRREELVQFLADVASTPPAEFAHALYEKADDDVATHLFCVAASLDSMVLGETQIIGQVRTAYEAARLEQRAGTFLHPLFQRAIAAGKDVLASTKLADGRTSVASVAVDYAQQVFESLAGKSILAIGAGKMSRLVLQAFHRHQPAAIVVAARDPDRAATALAGLGAMAVPMTELPRRLLEADVVVASTAATEPVLRPADFDLAMMRQRRFRPVLLIDIAVPRDIDPAVAAIDNVFLANLDDLQRAVQQSQSARQDAVTDARRRIGEHVEQYIKFRRSNEVGPAIQGLYQHFHSLAEAEVAKTLARLPDLSPQQQDEIRRLTQRLVGKLLHAPVQHLKAGSPAALHDPQNTLLRALEAMLPATPDPADAAPKPPDDSPSR